MATTKKPAVNKAPSVKTDFATMALKELHKKAMDLREEANELKRNSHLGDVQNVRAYKYKRRELARALTALNARRQESVEEK